MKALLMKQSKKEELRSKKRETCTPTLQANFDVRRWKLSVVRWTLPFPVPAGVSTAISSLVTRHFQQTLPRYSARNAIIGSTRLALHAGIQQARNAIPNKSKATSVKVIGSEVLTPYSRLFIIRAPPKAITNPHTEPIAARSIPC